jgi:hypothetical protein
MRATSPVLPGYTIHEVTFRGRNGEEDLVAAPTADGRFIVSRWVLTDEERQRIIDGQDVYLWLPMRDNHVPAVSLEIRTPEEIMAPEVEAATKESQEAVPEEWPTEIDG